MASLEDVVKEAMRRAGRPVPTSTSTSTVESDSTDSQVDNIQTTDTQDSGTPETEKLITQCVYEIIQMPCYNIKHLAAIRRTLRNVLKALVKENEYVTIGVIKRYVDPRNRYLVKSILNRAIDLKLVLSSVIEDHDTTIYQINHEHAEEVFNYLERV